MSDKKFKKVDALVVGAGFSGLYLTHRLTQRGLNVQTIEAGDGVGGTWYWNRYPGARVDIHSAEYSYSFSKELQNEWKWSEKYSPQSEILEYANHIADRFDLRKHILFNTKVTDAVYDDDKNNWTVSTNDGKTFETPFFIMATGCLSVPRTPNFKGMENFKGEFYHTGAWPHTPVSFEGKRVGVIGVGSSGIQSIPVIAETAKQTTVFIREANFTVPANNEVVTEEYRQNILENYDELRQTERYSRGGIALQKEPSDKSGADFTKEEAFKHLDTYLNEAFAFQTSFSDLAYNEETDKLVVEYLNNRIDCLVKDPRKAEILKPKNTHYADRRPVLDTDFYITFNKENADAVDVNLTPIIEFTEKGIRTSDEEYEFDMIVCATGYDAMTGAINRINIVGRNNQTLKEKWSGGPRSYLGLMSHGFPNLFTVTGPGSPSVLSNMLVSIEQHVEWIDDCLKYLQENNIATIEAELEAEDKWIEHANEIAAPLFISKGNSWYVGANVPGKPRVFMPYIGGVGAYRLKCEEVVRNGYEGFVLNRINANKQEPV